MCGICGIYNFNQGEVSFLDLAKMNQKMIHRGPDDDGIYLSQHVGIGMRRLSIIDTENGHQPIHNEDKTLWVVMNGEIYNHLELRQDLIKKGHVFYTKSDTEVIVHLYEEYGREAVQKLNGMFAFALFDKKKDALWIVRDRLGIKPLYFSFTSNRLLFSSDLKALSSLLPDKTIDLNSFFLYLGFHYIPAPNTIYQGVEKLQSGHELWCDGNGVKIRRYWQLSAIASSHISVSEAQEKLMSLLSNAIQLQLRSDVPVGFFLSGGVDSSAVAALAAKQGQENALTSFTIDFEHKHSKDAFFAKKIAEKYQLTHYQIPFSWREAIDAAQNMAHFLDEPVADSSIMPTYWLSRYAKNLGIKVLLTGAGGDEVFGGYARHMKPAFGSTGWLAENIPARLKRIMCSGLSLIDPDKAIRAKHPAIAYGAGYSGINLAGLRGLLKDPAIFSNVMKNYSQQLPLLSSGSKSHYAYNRMQTDLQHYLVDDVLSLTDKASMAASVEARVPLLDHRIVEFAFALQPKVNMHLGEAKGLFKSILHEMIPKDLLNRPKEGFNAPLFQWGNGAFGRYVCDALMEKKNPIFDQLFDQKEFLKLLSLSRKGHRTGISVFGFFVFNEWYHQNI